MKKINWLLLIAIVFAFVMGFTAESLMTVKPAMPKEVDIKICITNEEARSYILSQHYKGWILKEVAPDKYSTIVIMEKY